VPQLSTWRTVTFETLRRAFLKVAVRVEELKSRVHKAMISMADSIAAQGP
tara:strand:+ start:131 stop:280 length:150 start_codon:yes stop_codon:yes gene_type:complete